MLLMTGQPTGVWRPSTWLALASEIPAPSTCGITLFFSAHHRRGIIVDFNVNFSAVVFCLIWLIARKKKPCCF